VCSSDLDTLIQRIRNQDYAPGTKLPKEMDIMEEFGVSRTVVREAISHLQAAGMAETRHGIGTFVLPARDPHNFSLGSVDLATVGDVIALLELRISLETEAAGLAAQRRTDAQLAQMQTALDEFQTALGQENDAVPSDFAFHMEVARATHNRHFADLMGYLGTMVIPRARINTAQAAPEGRLNDLQRVHGEHESILSAIRNQDPEAARAAMRTHLSNSRERLRKTQSSEAPKIT
jgi:DNA-binding FadR family transcriptional regulator